MLRDRRTMLFAVLTVALLAHLCNAETWPSDEWERVAAADVGLDEALLEEARDYALTGEGSGYITRHGKLVLSWGDTRRRYDLKSTSKSIGVTALGLAIKDGKIQLSDKASAHHTDFGIPPNSNAASGWLDEITIEHLATQTAGFEKPGGYEPLLFRPGSKWHYSDGGPNWLAECVTLVYKRDIQELMFDRVFTPLGIQREDLRWRENAYRDHAIQGVKRREFGSGVHANVDAMARIGLLYLRDGRWRDRQILSPEFVARACSTAPHVVGLPEHVDRHGNASDHYGLLWWNNADGKIDGMPRDAYWSWGLYESLIVVIPSLDLVVSRAGKSWQRGDWAGHYDVLKPFFKPIVAAVRPGIAGPDLAPSERTGQPPYPPSRLITGVRWASPESTVRRAEGSDNWPLTWADDGAMYTAYGDGWGFKPMVEKKLSMGFSKIVGGPDDFRGINIRSNGETLGQGADGVKASGILMVDGVLYLLVRNADNSRLGWSTDYGKAWSWSEWKFTASFGCPTFLNFGKNYAGARDDYVYVYSMDSESAYVAADTMVLARVKRERLRERDAYEFFVRVGDDGQPEWSRLLVERGAVFHHPGRCYRSGVTYNAGLKRYIWCQIHPESNDHRGMRYEGGFGIYEAPEPWGPWSTVFFTNYWDVGPGETNSFPTKWMSHDGKTMHLVSSGDDHFSVRQVKLTTIGL